MAKNQIDYPVSSALEAVVYCKDCKYHNKVRCPLSDDYGETMREDEWFCADGVRKEVPDDGMEKVIAWLADEESYYREHGDTHNRLMACDTIELLKKQEEMNVDAFVQWCTDSHIMGDATVRGIKYWVVKYKEGL